VDGEATKWVRSNLGHQIYFFSLNGRGISHIIRNGHILTGARSKQVAIANARICINSLSSLQAPWSVITFNRYSLGMVHSACVILLGQPFRVILGIMLNYSIEDWVIVSTSSFHR
jgi:hypothetical protein